MSRPHAAKAARPTPSAPAPFIIGDWVKGWSVPEPGTSEQPQLHEGEVVQVGSGWTGVDAEAAYLWVRLPCGTERCLAIPQTTHTQRPAV